MDDFCQLSNKKEKKIVGTSTPSSNESKNFTFLW